MARPIDTAPKNGKVIFVGDDHGTIATAFWHGYPRLNPQGIDGFWAYAVADFNHIEQIDFTPTRWGETMDEFERD